jgi:hypothetical protein
MAIRIDERFHRMLGQRLRNRILGEWDFRLAEASFREQDF